MANTVNNAAFQITWSLLSWQKRLHKASSGKRLNLCHEIICKLTCLTLVLVTLGIYSQELTLMGNISHKYGYDQDLNWQLGSFCTTLLWTLHYWNSCKLCIYLFLLSIWKQICLNISSLIMDILNWNDSVWKSYQS